MATQTDKIQPSILPIPDRPHTGLLTYDAKDPDTKFPPIVPLAMLAGVVSDEQGQTTNPRCEGDTKGDCDGKRQSEPARDGRY